ncbi:MAG: ribonuclease H family protein [Saprospiraceae bacterium]|nr:ribonuclease H family protein [Saprospiraceae bacterium]
MAKYYVVWEGNEPGIYNSWTACQLQIKGYPGARYKSFKTRELAEAAYSGNYEDSISRKDKPQKPTSLPDALRSEINWDSICVDAACSGNPGKMEYQGVHTTDGAQIFHQAFPLGTNNIGEFLGIVHALALFHRAGKDTPIYTDSRNAMIWVNKKKCRTKLARTASTKQLYEVIERAEQWLATHTYKNPILKWQTDRWGEIPADFGRK